MTLTRVLDLDTGKVQVFSLDPARAVIAAYEQHRGNANTWEYTDNHDRLQFGPSGRTVFCGQFGAIT